VPRETARGTEWQEGCTQNGINSCERWNATGRGVPLELKVEHGDGMAVVPRAPMPISCVRVPWMRAHVRGGVHVSVRPGPAGDIYGAGHVATSTSSELLDV
jgi:hypothetical protein